MRSILSALDSFSRTLNAREAVEDSQRDSWVVRASKSIGAPRLMEVKEQEMVPKWVDLWRC